MLIYDDDNDNDDDNNDNNNRHPVTGAELTGTVLTETTPSSSFSLQWTSYGSKAYLFVMDESRQLDLSRDGAAEECLRHGDDASLVTVHTEEELQYLAEEIKRRVTAAGQEFAHEQWWTAGIARGGRWVWDVLGYPPGNEILTTV